MTDRAQTILVRRAFCSAIHAYLPDGLEYEERASYFEDVTEQIYINLFGRTIQRIRKAFGLNPNGDESLRDRIYSESPWMLDIIADIEARATSMFYLYFNDPQDKSAMISMVQQAIDEEFNNDNTAFH